MANDAREACPVGGGKEIGRELRMWGWGVSEDDDGLWRDGRVEDLRLGRLLRERT